MKNILFASTALVAFAGAAAADVAISGSAEMGLKGDKTAGATQNTEFHTDISVTFTMSGETDNGLSFGASIGLEDGGSANGTASIATDDGSDDYTVFVAFGNARLTMGDTDGAFDAAMQEVNVVGGSINDAETSHAGFNGNAGLDGDALYDAQVATFQYSAASFTGYASVMLDDAGTNDPVFGIGAKYATDLGGASVTVGLGYQSNGMSGATKRDVWGVSAKAAMTNGITGAVNYSVANSGPTETKHTGIGVGYSMNNIGLGLNWGQYDVTGGGKRAGYGLAATYDLGGGMVAQFGYGANTDHTTAANADDSLWSLGVAMSF